MNLMLDTYAIIELFRGSEKGEHVKALLENEKEIFVSVLSLYETGIILEREIGRKNSQEYLSSIETHYMIVDLNQNIALNAVRIRSSFKLPAIDCLIYSSARTIDAKVVSGCKHFKLISDQKDVIIL